MLNEVPTAPLNPAGRGSGSGETFTLTELELVVKLRETGRCVAKKPLETTSYVTRVTSYVPELMVSLPAFWG